ncbi:hypothetical protein CHUAL_005885 [Chamberlinius hualienensis]
MQTRLQGFFKDIKKLFHPHYFANLLLCLSFYVLRTVYPFCYLLFPETRCELNWREWEISIFMAVVIVFKTRKQGATSMLLYLSSAFMYCKIGNLILYMYNDPRIGIIYGVLCLVQLLLLPEPSYSGPQNIIYFRGSDLEEELKRDRRVVWVVSFYAAWSPACINLAPVFAELSSEYVLENLKFGKLDVARYPEVAKKFYVNDSSLSQQLPSILIFKDGKEFERRPLVDSKGHLQKFYFTMDNLKAAFDLNNLYLECKNNPLKKKKSSEKNAKAESQNHQKAE